MEEVEYADAVCVICGRHYECAAGRTFTCSDECHEKLVEILIERFGEYKKVCSMVTGKCYRVPTRTIIEQGITHDDLTKFPEWED